MSTTAGSLPAAAGSALEPSAFRAALADFPSGVVLVTTTDAEGEWKGFTASSFCGVSLEPPIVSACIYERAECYQAFRAAGQFAVSFLRGGHEELAGRFATKGGDKFQAGRFEVDAFGSPYLADSPWVMSCQLVSSCSVGDHEVLFGQVAQLRGADVEPSPHPLLYWQRRFSRPA